MCDITEIPVMDISDFANTEGIAKPSFKKWFFHTEVLCLNCIVLKLIVSAYLYFFARLSSLLCFVGNVDTDFIIQKRQKGSLRGVYSIRIWNDLSCSYKVYSPAKNNNFPNYSGNSDTNSMVLFVSEW